MIVVKAADRDIFDKVDTQYISNQLSDLKDIGILFICGKKGGEEDEWIDEKGMRYIVIHLPYEEVRKMQDIRPMMLAKAKEKLGLVA